MSGSEKLPVYDHIQPDLRYLSQPPFSSLPRGQAASSVSQIPHPFIAHIYPWAAGNERQNLGLNRFGGPISQPNSAAALVALAASSYADKNLSAQVLRGFQKQPFETPPDANGSVKSVCSSENPPERKRSRHQFDVDVSSRNSSSQSSSDHVTGLSKLIGSGARHPGSVFNSSPLHSAWQQFLFRFRNLDYAPDTSTDDTSRSSFGNIRDLSESGAGVRIGSELSKRFHLHSGTLARTSSDDAMPTGNDVDVDPFSSERSKSACDDVEVDGGHNNVTRKKSTSSFHGPEKNFSSSSSVTDRARRTSNNPFSLDNVDALSDDSFVSANRRSSSASSDQSRDDHQRKRRKRIGSLKDTCPVCGITVRPSDLELHIIQEIDKLHRLPSDTRKKFANSEQDLSRKRSCSSTVTTTSSWSSGKKNAEVSSKSDRSNRFKTYQKVRSNRLERLNSRVGQCLRAQQESGTFGLDDGGAWGAWSTHLSLPANCPVCCSRLIGTQSEMHEHIGRCLRKRNVRQRIGEEEGEVEVDVDDAPSGKGCHDDVARSSFDWKTRMQEANVPDAASLISTAGSFFIKQQRDMEADSVRNLNIEDDDTKTFGSAQYFEEDLLHEGSPQNREANDEPMNRKRKAGDESDAPPSENEVAELRRKIEQLENESNSNKCMICMDTYKDPVASVQCWHVHCEKCWLQVLTLKKLCPQCNAITPTAKLRRIYL